MSFSTFDARRTKLEAPRYVPLFPFVMLMSSSIFDARRRTKSEGPRYVPLFHFVLLMFFSILHVR